MLIAGLQKTSLLDYPDKIAAIVFTQGCNFRCGYCHNPELLKCDKKILPLLSNEDFFNFLKKRQGKLDGVVITGGEPCLNKNLIEFVQKIKEMNYLVKLDTNGSYTEILKYLIDNKMIDYVAMDIKAPLHKYHKITNTIVKLDNVQNSINMIMNSNIDYEFRTTVLKSQLTINDFVEISNTIAGAKRYFLQKFIPAKIYNKALLNEKSYTDEEFTEILALLRKSIKFVEVR